MKRFITIILLLALALTINAQIKVPIGSKSDVKKFFETTTYVVLKNELLNDYNEAIKEAINAQWTITPVKFIQESEFNKLRNDADKSFLMINKVYFEEDKNKTKFEFLILSLGGKYHTINDMPNLCAIPLCYEGDDEEKYLYKLGVMIKHCQTHLTTCKDHPELTSETIMDYYLKTSGSLATKKLYLLKKEVAKELWNKNEFNAIYPYDYELTDAELIAELINNDSDNAVITHIISPLESSTLPYCVKIVIDANTGMLYYYDTQKLKQNHDGYITANDLKKLAKK